MKIRTLLPVTERVLCCKNVDTNGAEFPGLWSPQAFLRTQGSSNSECWDPSLALEDTPVHCFKFLMCQRHVSHLIHRLVRFTF